MLDTRDARKATPITASHWRRAAAALVIGLTFGVTLYILRGYTAAQQLASGRLGEAVATGAREAVAEGVRDGLEIIRAAARGISFKGRPLTPELLAEVSKLARGASDVGALRERVDNVYGPGAYREFVDAYVLLVSRLLDSDEFRHQGPSVDRQLLELAYRKLLFGYPLSREEQRVMADFAHDFARLAKDRP